MALTGTELSSRAVAKCGWAILVAVGAALTLNGVGQYVLVATSPGGRGAGILLTGVGLAALTASLDGWRHGSRLAWNITWIVVAMLAALGAHVLLGGMRDFGGWHLPIAAAALAGQVLAAADRAQTTPEHPTVRQQLQAAYPIGFAYAAGVFGIIGGLQLLGFFIVDFGLPRSGGPLGSANDLMGAPTGTVMIPVALALHATLRPRQPVLLTLTGVVAMVGVAVSGPLLVYEVIDFFPTQLAIGAGSAALLLVWITLTSRLVGRFLFWSAPARLGRALGSAFVAALALLAVSLLLPSTSIAQQIVLGAGLALGGLAWLAMPLWFLLVGAQLTTATDVLSSRHMGNVIETGT
jgi:hypothetical protein